MTPDTKLRDELAGEYKQRGCYGDDSLIYNARTRWADEDFIAGWDARAKYEDENVKQLKEEHKRLLEAHGRVLINNEKVRRLVEACKELIEECPDVYGEGSLDGIIEALKEFER